MNITPRWWGRLRNQPALTAARIDLESADAALEHASNELALARQRERVLTMRLAAQARQAEQARDANAQIAAAVSEAAEARQDADKAAERLATALAELDEARRKEAAAYRATAAAYEPVTEGECHKTRLHTREEAEAFRADVTTDLGVPLDSYRAYKCQVCPRHPFTTQRFWHIGHVHAATADAKYEEKRRAARRRHEGRDGTRWIGDRLDPQVVETLRSKVET